MAEKDERTESRTPGEFPQASAENLRVWDANAAWWDGRIGDGNEFQDLLIEPATERLLEIAPGDRILDIACGAGRFARRLAGLGATVTAFDHSAAFIGLARQRTEKDAAIEYHVLDASDSDSLLSLAERPFDKVVCTMALMDMPEVRPLIQALPQLLRPRGCFVFSVTHPCFNAVGAQRFCETYEEDGRQRTRAGVKVWGYLDATATKSEGIVGQPESQYYFHRPLHLLLRPLFDGGFVVDGLEEPRLPSPENPVAGIRWNDLPEIPPVLVIRTRLGA